MKSIESIYKIGHGPSSSHTVGPYNAALRFSRRFPDADRVEVTLYGSLAMTGEGHGTSRAICAAIPCAHITADRETTDLPHPNTMDFAAYREGKLLGTARILSIGGGALRVVGEETGEEAEVYPERNFSEIAAVCREKKQSLLSYVNEHEPPTFRAHLRACWHAMEAAVERGIAAEGILPGGLFVQRKAKMLYENRCHNEPADVTMTRTISAYAYAVSEENADENLVVTAPTCGSCGVIPAVFYYMRHDRGFSEEEILDALAVAGLFGNVIRTNASISGAECGCQAEIGSACSMAASGLALLEGLTLEQTEYAAEIAMEHHLGLTCDPIRGLVQIPCIERNAVAALCASSCVNLARFLVETRKISFDDVVETMYRTGKDMSKKYKETSHGGLAELCKYRESTEDGTT